MTPIYFGYIRKRNGLTTLGLEGGGRRAVPFLLQNFGTAYSFGFRGPRSVQCISRITCKDDGMMTKNIESCCVMLLLQVLRNGIDQAGGDRRFETESGHSSGRRGHMQVQAGECDNVRLGNP
jgi:hypothetical protein